MVIDNKTFANETLDVASGSAADGAALQYSAKTGTTPTLTITNTTIANNTLNDSDKSNGAYGGAVSIGGGINVIMDNVTMSQNIATTSGGVKAKTQGGAYWQSTGTIDANNWTLSHNKTMGSGTNMGGAAALFAVHGTIKNSDFSNNSSNMTNTQLYGNNGGALFVQGGTWGGDTDVSLKIEKTTFDTNSITAELAYGGALAIEGATNAYMTVKLDELDFSNNSVNASEAGNGGAVSVYNATLEIANSDFENNSVNVTASSASGLGGALYNEKSKKDDKLGTVKITNSNFKANSAATDGGAIYSTGTVTINNAEFIGNEAKSYAGAIYNGQTGKITIENSIFKNNLAHNGGALIAGKITTGTTIKNSTFENNTADAFGAVGLFKLGELENVTFTANKATSAEMNTNNGAGALFLGAESVVKITNGSFNQNESATSGGAIAMRATDVANNSAAKLDIIGTTFDGNIAATQGGAIYSTFYNSEQKVNNVAITGATFTNNQANEGGAIYNEGQADIGGNKAAMYIENSTFTGNTAKTNGGALFVAEGGTVELAGTNTFSGNKANGILNDIHNNGTLNVSGALTLDGGITGTGSVVFADNTSLTAALKNSTIVAKSVTIGNNVALNLRNIVAGTYDFINGSTTGSFTFAEDVLFEITQDGNKITATAKAAEDIASDAGVSEDAAEVLAGLGNASADNEKAQAVLNTIQSKIAAGNTEVVEQIVENINPTTAPVAQSVATEVNGQIMTLVGARLAPATGRSGGDYKIDAGGVWAKALYNRSKQDGAFRGYTQGIAMGIDSVIEDVFTLGVGYAYNNTDIKADARKTDVKGHNFFVYGEYQPSEWFVNTALSYSKSDYKEQKQLVGTDAKYNVETYGAQAIAGYDFANGLTPQAGLRYLHVKQDSHTDGLSYVDAEDTDLLTAVAGINYAKDFAKEKATFTPEVRLAATYDVVSDGAEANVVLGGSSYVVKGDRLPRFGVEAGLGLQMNIADRVDINVDYDLGIRRDYTSHTGTVSLKYNF